MARTTQTARAGTGGKAPRTSLPMKAIHKKKEKLKESNVVNQAKVNTTEEHVKDNKVDKDAKDNQIEEQEKSDPMEEHSKDDEVKEDVKDDHTEEQDKKDNSEEQMEDDIEKQDTCESDALSLVEQLSAFMDSVCHKLKNNDALLQQFMTSGEEMKRILVAHTEEVQI